jgi:ubiquinone/menaquinone biosynthesis C-methylase UbiE
MGMAMLTNLERYQRIAAFYDLLDLPFEYGRYRTIRPLLFQGLSGRLLDAGVGTGRNFPYYPPGSNVVGIDLSPAMLARAERRRNSAAAPVELRQMDVTRLELPDGSFDAAVSTFLFCVLPNELQTPALKELGRVVKPTGEIRLLEYVRPQGRLRRVMAKLWEPWIAWAYGAGFDRQTEKYIPEAGLKLVDSHFVVDDLLKLIRVQTKT